MSGSIGTRSHLNTSTRGSLKVYYTGNPKLILSFLDKLEKNNDLKRLYILYEDLKTLKKDFISLFQIVIASGGVVLNDEGEMLMIFRRGFWDLPKGKLDNGETKKEAAIREVIEETGLENVKLIKKLTTTFHIYKSKDGRRFLKPSHWYLMFTRDKKVKPQFEEDIEEVAWFDTSEIDSQGPQPVYPNIMAVVGKMKAYLKFGY